MLRLHDANIRLLRVFATVAECGGFSQAQAKLDSTLSTISTQIAGLETRLGVRLCDRGRGGFQLTEEGKKIYDASQLVFSSLEEFSSVVGSVRGQLVGELVIGIEPATITNPSLRLSTAIQRFSARQSDLNLSIRALAPNDLQVSVLNGICHIGIGSFHHQVSGLFYDPMFVEDDFLYCGRDHPLFARADDDLDFENIEEAKFADYAFSDAAPKCGIKLDRDATASSMEALAQLILSGCFVGFLPAHYAQQWVDRDLMRVLRPDQLFLCYEFQVVLRKGAETTYVVKTFLEDFYHCHGRDWAPPDSRSAMKHKSRAAERL